MESKILNSAELIVKDKNLTEKSEEVKKSAELKNLIPVVQPTPFLGIWKGIYNDRLIKIILETTNQSQMPVGWYYWCNLNGEEESQKNFLTLIDYNEKTGLILLENNSERVGIKAWLNTSSCNNMMIGTTKENSPVLLMKTNV